MKDKTKTKLQLAEDLAEMRRRVAALEKSEIDGRRAEKALRESEERWHFALEGAGNGVWDWNAQTNKVYFSRQWKAMLGFEEHEIGDTLDEWDKRIHQDDRDYVHREINKHLEGITPVYSSEHRVMCKDGTYKWILDRGQVISHTDEGKPLRVIGAHADITNRKQAEELYKTMAESSLAGVFIIQDGKFRFVNTTAIADIGYTPDELIGKDADCLIHPEDKAAVAIKTREMLKAKDPTPYEYRIVTKQGKIMWLMQTSTYIQYEGKTAILGNAMNITEHKRAEEALRESENKFKVLAEKAIVGVYLILAYLNMLIPKGRIYWGIRWMNLL
jgi:PAS domain S-box-containing protein